MKTLIINGINKIRTNFALRREASQVQRRIADLDALFDPYGPRLQRDLAEYNGLTQRLAAIRTKLS